MLIAEGFELFAISLCFESWGRNHNLPLAGKAHEKTLRRGSFRLSHTP